MAGMPLAFVLVAMAFAVVTGANEGGAIITMGLLLPWLRPLGAIVVIVAGVVGAPLVLGIGVAETLSEDLVAFHPGGDHQALGVALVAAMLVVAALTVLGIPTSLSLALIGGITGSGVGFGLPVSWSVVVTVLVVGVVATLLAGVGGAVVARALRWLPAGRHARRAAHAAMTVGYVAQAVAYGANGGQKMLAVFAIGAGAGAIHSRSALGTLAVIGSCFAVGVALSLRRVAGRLGRDLMVVRPVHAMSAEYASSAAVLSSLSVDMPVSMTQAIGASLVGAGVTDGVRRVRWKAAARLATAWAVTLPCSVFVAVDGALVIRSLS